MKAVRTPTEPSAAARRPIVRLAEEILREVDEHAQTMARAVHDGIPELSADLTVLTQNSCRANIGLICSLLSEGQEPTAAVAPGEALLYAREFVHLGLPEDHLLRTYRIGHATLWRTLLARVGDHVEEADDLVASAELASDWMFRYVDVLSRQMSDAYHVEYEQWTRSAAARRADDVRALLAGQTAPVDAMSQRLRYELRRRHVAFVVWGAEDPEDVDSLAAAARRVATDLGAGDLLAVPLARGLYGGWLGFRAADSAPAPASASASASAAAPASASASADAGPRADPDADGPPGGDDDGIRVAIGAQGEGVDGFRRSHRQALRAKRVATLVGGSAACTRYQDVELLSLLVNDLEAAGEFVDRELGALAGDAEFTRRLADTLRIYLEEGASVKRTAHRCGIHGNTVIYRIRRATETLGHPATERQLELGAALALVDVLRRHRASEPDV